MVAEQSIRKMIALLLDIEVWMGWYKIAVEFASTNAIHHDQLSFVFESFSHELMVQGGV